MAKRVPWSPRGPVPTQTDVVVIGSGLGGLMTATILANRDRKVAVMEAHSLPGGYAHSFRRRGFSFDVSQHHVGGLIHRGETTRETLDQIGVFDKLKITPRETLMVVGFPDEEIRVPNGGEAVLASLVDRFPKEEAGLRRLFAYCEELRGALLTEAPNARELELKGIHRDAVWSDVSGTYLSDAKLLATLDQLWMHVGLPPGQAAANYWMKVFASFYLDGSAHIGGDGLAQAFCSRLQDLGSNVYTNRAVEQILLTDGRASGVRLEDGTEVKCDIVVSNADARQTYLDLLPVEATSKALRFRLERQTPSTSIYATYVGLNSSPQELNLSDGIYFHCASTDIERAHHRAMANEIGNADWTMTNYGGLETEGSKAQRTLSFCELTPAGNWFDMEPDEYAQRKEEVGEQLFQKYLRRFPELEDRVAVRVFGTPRTMKRYTRNHAGAIYGFDQTPAQANTLRLGNRSPVPGLYLASSWSRPGGGYEGAMLSGMEAATEILGEAVFEYTKFSAHVRSAKTQTTQAAPSPQTPATAPSPTPAVSQSASFPFRLYYQDTDSTRHGYHGSLLRALDRGRPQALASILTGTTPPTQGKAHVAVSKMDVRFMNAASLGDRLEGEVKLIGRDDDGLVLRERLHLGETVMVEAQTKVRLRGHLAAASERVQTPPETPARSVSGVRAPLRKIAQPFVQYSRAVGATDTDAEGEMTVEACVRILEAARYEAFEQASSSFLDELIEHHGARIYRITLDAPGVAHDGDSLCVNTAAHLDSTFRLTFDHEMILQDSGRTIATAQVDLLCVDKNGKLTAWPDDIGTKFQATPPPSTTSPRTQVYR